MLLALSHHHMLLLILLILSILFLSSARRRYILLLIIIFITRHSSFTNKSIPVRSQMQMYLSESGAGPKREV